MKKTIDTEVVTEDMIYEMKAFESNQTLTEDVGIKAILKAAPEVKTQPIGTLILGGIDGNEYGEIDIDLKSKALEALQEELVSSENPVVLKVYAHPPAQSDLVERIRALEIAEPMGWMDRCHNGVVAKIVELIEGAK